MNMGSYILLSIIPLLYIGRATSTPVNGTTEVKQLDISPEDAVSDIAYQLYSETNGNNTFNISFLEFTTVTTPKRRRRILRRPPPLPVEEFLNTVDQYVMPVALCLGIVGNILIFPIFAYSPLKGNALSHYLAAMAVADFLYLVSCLISWTTTQGLTIYDTIGVCQLTQFFLRISKFLATWYLYAAHVERCVVHFEAFCSRPWCSTFRSKFIIIFIFIFSVVGYLHYVWTNVLLEWRGEQRCALIPETVKHLLQLWKIESIAGLFLPMLLILLIDIVLFIYAIVKRYKLYFRVPSKNGSVKSNPREDELGEYVLASRRRSGVNPNRSRGSTPPPPEFNLNLERRSATLVVVICGILFIALLLPSSVYTTKYYFFPSRIPPRNERWAMQLFEQLVKFNSVYKFLLYFIVLRPFRYGLVYLFKCRAWKKPNEIIFQETTEV